MTRQGILVEPYQRLKSEQVERIHQASLAILTDPGVVCFNRNAAEIFSDYGAEVSSIDQEDTNWIVVLKDVGPDVGRRTARAAEREIADNLPEKELTRGWLKASNRAMDTERSTPWKPWHPLTRAAAKPVVPGEIIEYQIDILPNANMFRRGHRICLEITSMDLATGTAGYTDIEYIPYHICSHKTTVHNIYHSHKYPSRLLLPIIPADAQQWIE